MQSETNKEIIPANELSPSELYDLYAPAVYGKILGIVHKVPIADKLLEKVFIKGLQDKNLFANIAKPPLLSLLNQSRKKCYQTIKALNIFNECCAGASVSVNDKKVTA
jgi:hypothetical protein